MKPVQIQNLNLNLKNKKILKQIPKNDWESVRLPVRAGFGLGRYQTGPNSKFKFEFKKLKNS